MHTLLRRQLAIDFCCTESDVTDAQHHFTVFVPHQDRRQYQEITPCVLKVAIVNGKLLFTGREDIIARCRELYANASGPWFMEQRNLIALNRELAAFGAQLRHARPFSVCGDMSQVDTGDLVIRRYEGTDIEAFRGDERFSNAYGFCETAPDMLGVSAERDGVLLGMAGVSADSPDLWQIGIDVLPEARGQGVAETLVALIKNEVLARGHLPYYGTGVSHLASQRVALRCGFLPSWFELVAAPIE